VVVVGVVVVEPPIVVVVGADVVDVLVPWVVLVVLEPGFVVVTLEHGVEPEGPTRLAMQATNAPVAESICAVSPVVRQSAFASARAKPFVSPATHAPRQDAIPGSVSATPVFAAFAAHASRHRADLPA
jgi:hypothetical protein